MQLIEQHPDTIQSLRPLKRVRPLGVVLSSRTAGRRRRGTFADRCRFLRDRADYLLARTDRLTPDEDKELGLLWPCNRQAVRDAARRW